MEKGFRPVRRMALGLCGVGHFARAHVKSPTFHSRSQCISTERKHRHICSVIQICKNGQKCSGSQLVIIVGINTK